MSFGGWLAVLTEGGERHALPLDDLRPHDESPACWCKPTLDGDVLVHNSLDGREWFEPLSQVFPKRRVS